MGSSFKMIRIKVIWYIISCISVYTLCLMAGEINTEPGVKYVFKVKENGTRTLFRHLLAHNLTLRSKITPSTYIFDYIGSRRKSALHRTISNITKLYINKIKAWERVREFEDTLKPGDTDRELLNDENVIPDNILYSNLVCDHYYGMGVHKAWSNGHTGTGVTIAITDVGINTELLDLKNSINTNLSYNFVEENSDVTPEYFHNIRTKSSYFTDHGNKVASIIAATKGNDICSAGIAYNATIIALKIYKVKVFNNQVPELEPSHWTRSDILARALVYKLDIIDIFTNAWAPTKSFGTLDLATRDAISFGAKHGRHGLGTIHVVPSGPPGNGLSNNVHTITVNSIGRDGAIPNYTYIDASVLTSGLGDGNNLTASSMVTTTLRNRCVTGFNGVSAATAQISAVIGLAVGANNKLSLRDVQHLLVYASDHNQLRKEKIAFRKNAAGRYFHGVFGFGLVDADKLVTRALKQVPTPKLRTKTLKTYITRQSLVRTQTLEFCHGCNKSTSKNCLVVMEHIMVTLDLKSNSDEIKMAIESPSNTTSVLMVFRPRTGNPVAVRKLRLVSVHFWDEIAFGTWRLYVQDRHSSSRTKIRRVSLKLYGTADLVRARFELQGNDTCRANSDSGNDDITTSSPHVTSAPLKSPKPAKISNSSSDINALVVWLVIMAVLMLLMFLFISYMGYHMLLLSCPTRNGSVSNSEYTNPLQGTEEDN